MSNIRRQLRRYLRRFLTVAGCLIVFLIFWAMLSPSTFKATLSWMFDLSSTVSSSGGYDGIDVSKHQGKIDWQAVSEDGNIQFVYIKATEGSTLSDKRYATNIREARKAGLKVGSYHFFTTRRSAKEQFSNFRRHVRKSEQDLIPMVDVEESGCKRASKKQLQQSLQEFMDLVKSEYGYYPLLYSQYRFYNDRLAPEFNKYYIFIARYGNATPHLKGGGLYNIWQYTERGHISGIRGEVDLDRFGNGTSLSDIMMND